MLATTTCLTLVCGSASCSTAAKFSSTTMASAPQSLSWNSSSRGLYSGLTFTAGHAGAQDAGDRHRILQHVRHHDGDAGAALEALALQPGGEGARGGVELGIGQALAHADAGRPCRHGPGSFPRTSPPARGSATCRSRRARPADNSAAKVVALAFPHCRRARSMAGGRSSEQVAGSRVQARPERDQSIAGRSRAGPAQGRADIYRSTPPKGTSGLSVRAARSGRSTAAAPRKASNSSRDGALGQVAGDEHQPGAVVVVRPALEPRGRVEDVLHAVHHHRRVRHFGELHDALDAQQLGAMGRAQQFEEHLQRAGGDRGIGGEHEGADMLVVAVDVV